MHFPCSKPVKIALYNPDWPSQFSHYATKLRGVLGNCALRIDHIGSTAVPNLAAKDIIDIQISIADLDNADELVDKMQRAGYRKRGDIRYDELVGAGVTLSCQLRKLYFREPEGHRRVHMHVRQIGFLNQRYALVFRDYLRANADVRQRYELIKTRLAELFPAQIEGYLHIKDPLMDIIYAGASSWAKQTGWQMDSDYY